MIWKFSNTAQPYCETNLSVWYSILGEIQTVVWFMLTKAPTFSKLKKLFRCLYFNKLLLIKTEFLDDQSTVFLSRDSSTWAVDVCSSCRVTKGLMAASLINVLLHLIGGSPSLVLTQLCQSSYYFKMLSCSVRCSLLGILFHHLTLLWIPPQQCVCVYSLHIPVCLLMCFVKLLELSQISCNYRNEIWYWLNLLTY